MGVDEIQEAQGLSIRLQNLFYGDLTGTELNPGVPRNQSVETFKKSMKQELKRLRCGAVYDRQPELLTKQLESDNRKPNPLVSFLRRGVGFVWRRMRRILGR